MLTGMDIPVTAGPWLVLGVVLGILLPLLAALGVLAMRPGRTRTAEPSAAAPSPTGLAEDDLPGFLESPPGSAPPPAPRADGWAALSSPATPPPTPASPPERSTGTGVLVAMAVTALLLIGAAAAVATTRTTNPAVERPHAQGAPGPTTQAPRPDAVSARLAFDGVVLERHPVGVTVAYPRVQASAAGDRAAAEVELATFNCLSGEAPEDPVAAGCTRSVTEHAELSTPELEVVGDGTELRFSGRFPTFRRPNGSPPVTTGRVYELTVRVAPRDGRAGQGQEQATGVLELGDDRVGTSDGEPNAITYGD
jgi:hypothetical protein